MSTEYCQSYFDSLLGYYPEKYADIIVTGTTLK